MHRRRYLGLTTGALAGLAGCGGAPREADDPTASPTPTRDEPELGVGVETDRYLVRTYAQRPIDRAIDPDQVVPIADVSEPLRDALRTAVADEYRAASVSEAFLAAIDGFRRHSHSPPFRLYVSVDGTPYAFDPTVPVFTAHLEMGVEDPDPDRTIGPDDLGGLSEPVAAFVRTIGAFTVEVAQTTYRRSVVPDEVLDFLDAHDYVRDPDGVGRIVTDRVDPGPPYSITASELTAEELWGHPVLAASSFPPPLRRFLEAAVASDRRAPVTRPDRTEYRTNTLPASYGDHLGPEHGPTFGPYVDLGGTLYAVRATEIRRDAMPIAVSAAVAGPRSFTVTVEPSSAGAKPAVDGPIELQSPGALPSVLWVKAGSERHLLDSDAYGSTWWSDGSRGERIEETAEASVAPEGDRSATYRIPAAVPGGTYAAWGQLQVSWTPRDEERPTPPLPFPFQVALQVPPVSTE